MRISKQQAGYSLLETVIYVALIALILTTSTALAISALRALNVLRTNRAISQNGDIAMETMIRDIRAATSTVIAGSVFGQSPGTLKIGTTTFSLIGAVFNVQNDTGGAEPITGSNVQVSSLVFYRAATTSSEIISIFMTIDAGQGYSAKSKKYYGSAVLRGAYK